MFALFYEENSQIFPFFFLDKIELLELNGVDLPSHLKLLGNYDIKSKLANMPNLNDFDLDENLIHKVNSNYQDIISFQKIRKTKNSFSLFHSNLRSLSSHFDELQLLLNALKLQFDVIGISESKEMAKVCNHYFTHIASKIDADIPRTRSLLWII